MATEHPVGFSRVALRLMLAAGAAALLAGCSDASRFSSDPFSDPFGSAPAPASRSARTVDRSSTGSISGSPNYAPVQSRPLAPPTNKAPVASAAPPAQAAAVASPGSYNHWSAEGGTPVTVGTGETAAILANRYGVPSDVLLKVNGFSSPSQVQAGSRLVVPVYRSTGATARREPEAHTAKDAHVEAKPSPKHVAAKADAEEEEAPARKADHKGARSPEAKPPKLAKSDEKKAKTPDKKAKVAAKSDDSEDDKPVKAKTPPTKGPSAPQPAKTASKVDEASKPKAQAKLAKAGPVTETREPSAPLKSAAKAAEKSEQAKVAANETPAERAPPPERKVDKTTTTAAIAPAGEAKTDAAHPEFRWPARGRIIQGFANGGNDGINISVPEGTQVKAAESGVVAYAGSELKGYGNLVLIRHPNGFVSAYAHNGDIAVKRGDQVTRGQTIAKSGQSGNVSSPQLHFELRKGSTPVDPTDYLAGL